MVIKFILNILINIGIFALLMCLLWAFNHAQYPVMAGAVVVLALFVVLKIRMLKSIRQLAKNR